jgi:trehalose 6-phosphate phosphatase
MDLGNCAGICGFDLRAFPRQRGAILSDVIHRGAHAAFIRDQELALFLDVDGTLLEIASTPDRVRVPASLRNTLQLTFEREHGALALLSGRSLDDLDELFSPCDFPASGKHGLEVRLPSGKVIRPNIDPTVLDRARRWLGILQQDNRGLLLEDKGVALAMHYRLVPRLATEVEVVMNEMAAELGETFIVRPGKCVYELMPRGYDERSAIQLLMKERAFAGRTPVFVGDDPTDEVGFQAVNEMGGHSIRVGNLEKTAAQYRFSSVSTVVAWLRDRNLSR